MRVIPAVLLSVLLGVACLEEDFDGDGFGVSEDCDDHNGFFYPGAPEICNGRDEDCDGVADNGHGPDSVNPSSGLPATPYYVDWDHDGFGDEATAIWACDYPTYEDWVLVGGDCDDTRWRVYPGAPETCGDVDFNCDGGLPPVCDPDEWAVVQGNQGHVGNAADIAFSSAFGGEDFGHRVLAADVDGLPVFLVGTNHGVETYTFDDFPIPRGSYGVNWGPWSFGGRWGDFALFEDHVLIALPEAGSDKGIVHAADLVLVGDGTTLDGSEALVGEHNGWALGSEIAVLDEFAAAGTPEVALGAPGAEELFAGGGAVLLFEVDGTQPSAGTEIAQIDGEGDDHALGNVVTATDLDGDGVQELLLGLPDVGDGGEVWLVAGPFSGNTVPSDNGVLLSGPTGARAGARIEALGDLDGDGTDDVGVVGGEVGVAWLLRSMPSGDVALDTFDSVDDAGGTGEMALGGGDLNGDGVGDLSVGMPYRGAMGVMPGPIGAGITAVDLTTEWSGDPGLPDHLWLDWAPDVDGDGDDELLVGAPEAALVLYGRADW